MADVEAIATKLRDIEAIEGVGEAILVSRGGKYIAGDVPSTADADTYAAMVATLMGSAETVVYEARETLKAVVLNLEKSRILVIQDGSKALYALRVSLETDIESIIPKVQSTSSEIESLL